MSMQALFGTRFAADLNVVAQILMLAGLWVGFYFARTRQRTKHKNMQTTVVLAQLFFIAFVMTTSFYNYVVAGRTTAGAVAQLMIIHGSLGLVAEVSGIYLILRMRTQLIPQRLRIRNFKLLMRSTLALWTAVALLGFGVYYFRYLRTQAVSPTAPLAQLRLASDDLVVHAAELERAISRSNLESARRHAEHLVLLIEGRNGINYGDIDGDGTIEDPGDGTGLVAYLLDVGDATSDSTLASLVETASALAVEVNANALRVFESSDLLSMGGLGADSVAKAKRVGEELIAQIETRAAEEGIEAMTIVAPVVPGTKDEPSTVNVVIDKFVYTGRDVTIGEGWTVVWVNNEAPKHTVTSDNDLFKSGSMSKGDTFTFTFDEVGKFPYFCRFHGDKGNVGMAGSITVAPASQLGPVPTAPATPPPPSPTASSAAPAPLPTSTVTPAATATPSPIATVPPTRTPTPPTQTPSPGTTPQPPSATATSAPAGATPPTPTATAAATPLPATATATPTATVAPTATPAVTVQSAAIGPSKDNTLYQTEDGSTSSGAGQHIFAGNTNSGATRRGVIAFDVAASVPAGSKITSVSLRLHMSRSQAGAESVRLHRLAADWGEGASAGATDGTSSGGGGGVAATTGDATWVHAFFNTVGWAVAGGDFAPTPSGEASVGAAAFYTWSSDLMVGDVQGWLDDPSTNFGWVLLGNETQEQTAKRFESKENSVAANRPVLTVEYKDGS